ncbi:MAG: OsmC family protein [Bacteroidetes bacterium]|nr:OsmC family protein [Bacteroidota bacterium]
MSKEHLYKLTATWHGNKGTGTSGLKDYDRSHTVSIANKPELHLTTDNPFVGDKTKLNPEDLLVSAIASCHMLSYLYLCALEGVVVIDYIDNAIGLMIENPDGGGQFKEVNLNPVFSVTDASMVVKAVELHHKAHEICYIANSVNFPVICIPVCEVKGISA